MEQMKKLKWLIVLVGFVSFSSQATSRFSLSCPSKFIGTVTSVTDVDSSFRLFKLLKAILSRQKKFKLLKMGQLILRPGKLTQ